MSSLIQIKLLGSVLVLLSGYLSSKRLSSSSKREIETTEAVIDLVSSLMNKIDALCIPISDILKETDPELFRRCGYDTERLPQKKDDLLKLCSFKDDNALYGCFSSFVLALGGGYKSEEAARCAVTRDELHTLLQKRRSEYDRKRKTIPTVCMCIAVGVVIILL